MTIIVTGSTGHISTPLTQHLVQAGHQVTCISSNPNKAEKINALGAKVAIGSVEDRPCLTAAFNGANAVYTMIPPRLDILSWKTLFIRWLTITCTLLRLVV